MAPSIAARYQREQCIARSYQKDTALEYLDKMANQLEVHIYDADLRDQGNHADGAAALLTAPDGAAGGAAAGAAGPSTLPDTATTEP